MMTQKNTPRPAKGRRTTDEQLKDEVYRHMFRLEANRQGADSISQLLCCEPGWPLTSRVESLPFANGSRRSVPSAWP